MSFSAHSCILGHDPYSYVQYVVRLWIVVERADISIHFTIPAVEVYFLAWWQTTVAITDCCGQRWHCMEQHQEKDAESGRAGPEVLAGVLGAHWPLAWSWCRPRREPKPMQSADYHYYLHSYPCESKKDHKRVQKDKTRTMRNKPETIH